MITDGKRIALAITLASLPGATWADPTYYDYLGCAAVHLARADFDFRLQRLDPEKASAQRASVRLFIDATLRLVPQRQVPCGDDLLQPEFRDYCIAAQIVMPQIYFLYEDHLASLVEVTNGIAPVPACADDPACAKCDKLTCGEGSCSDGKADDD